jgi:hypothetical protein
MKFENKINYMAFIHEFQVCDEIKHNLNLNYIISMLRSVYLYETGRSNTTFGLWL